MYSTECPIQSYIPAKKMVSMNLLVDGKTKVLQTTELNFWKMIVAGMEDTISRIVKQIQQSIADDKPTAMLFIELEEKVAFYKSFIAKKPQS